MNNRANRVLALAVVGLLLLAGAAVALSLNRSEPDLPAGSPEATVQSYLREVYAGDTEAALTHVDPDGGCRVTDLEDGYLPADSRVVLRETSTRGSTASVEVDVVRPESGPFAGTEWSDTQIFRLQRVGDAWLITGVPWPAYRCDENESDR